MGGDKQYTSSTRALLVLFIVKWRFGSGHLQMSEKKQQKNKSPAISLNHQPILYYLYSHPANRWQQKSTHTFLFSFFFLLDSQFFVDIQVRFSKNTHKQKKLFHRVFSRSPETQWSCKNCTSLVKRCWSSSPCA